VALVESASRPGNALVVARLDRISPGSQASMSCWPPSMSKVAPVTAVFVIR
jgi:hypothetical protein